MSEKVMDFSYCDELVKDFEKVIEADRGGMDIK